MTAQRQMWGVAVGLVLIVGGLLFGNVELWPTMRTARSSSGWIRTPCKISATRVVKGSMDVSGQPGIQVTWLPVVEFQYEWAGKTYTSEKENLVGWIAQNRSKSEAQAFVAQFPEGSEKTCFVNPAKPQQAVLYRRIPLASALWILAVPLAIVVLGGFFIVGGLLGKLHGPNWVAAQPRSFDPSKRPPGRGLTAYVEGDAIVLSIGPHVATQVTGALAIAFGVVVVVGPVMDFNDLSSVPWWVGAAAVVFGVAVVFYDLLVIEQLVVSAAAVTRQLSTPWGSFHQKTLGAGAINQVVVDYDPKWNMKGSKRYVRTVQIASWGERISFGFSLSEKQRLWVQDCVLEVIGK